MDYKFLLIYIVIVWNEKKEYHTGMFGTEINYIHSITIILNTIYCIEYDLVKWSKLTTSLNWWFNSALVCFQNKKLFLCIFFKTPVLSIIYIFMK